MTVKNQQGISVIVCCYNSANRIGKTLSNLSKQENVSDLSWEVIIVDNASTDHTADISLAIWQELGAGTELRVVSEPRPGLGNARRKGITEASYSFLLFCDDDNWLSENYVRGMYELLGSDPNIAACGGMGVPVFETEEPRWFYEYAEAFALGSQDTAMENGQILSLYGAGLAVRKHIVEDLIRDGFEQLLPDRSGKTLSSSGDTELTNAMVLRGYRLACTDDLKFFHYLPKERLTFSYLRALFIAFGTDGPVRNLYYSYITGSRPHRLLKSWHIHLLLSLVRVVKYGLFPPKKYGRGIYYHWSIAYIKQLLVLRKGYPEIKRRITRIKERGVYGPMHNISKNAGLVLDPSRSL